MSLHKKKMMKVFDSKATTKAVTLEQTFERFFGRKGEQALNVYKEFLDRLIEKILGPLRNNEVVLDFGCGFSGRWAAWLSEKTKNYVGCDISRGSLKSLRKSLKVNVMLCDGENLPIRDNVINLVVSFDTLEHFPSIEKGLWEIARVITEKGKFLCKIPNRDYFVEKLFSFRKLIFGSQASFKDKWGHINFQTPSSLEELLGKVGLKTEENTATTLIYPGGGIGIGIIGRFVSTYPFIVMMALFNFKSAISILNLEHQLCSKDSFRKIAYEIIVLARKEHFKKN